MNKHLKNPLSKTFSKYVGITTLVGGGTGPATGTRATTCTPAPSQMKLMLQATDDLPLNFGFTGKVSFLPYPMPTFKDQPVTVILQNMK